MDNPKVSYVREYVCTLSATLAALSTATHFGWTSPTLPILLGPDSPLKITEDESSWIVSLMPLGSVAGPIAGAFLANSIGRKNTVVLSAVPFILSWVLILVAESAAVLYVARFIAGIAFGLSYTALPMYLGEIASDKIRGSLGTLITTVAKLGVLISYSIGPFVSYGVLPYILMVIPIALLVSYLWLPETPYYYLTKHRTKDAMSSLKYLRTYKTEKELETEFNLIYNSVKSDQENKGTLKELFQSRGNQKALLIVFGCFSGMHLCGSQAVLAYSQQIFEDAGGILGPSDSVIVFGAVQLLVALVTSSIVDRVGRRPLLLVSIGGVTVTSGLIGTYFFYKDYLKVDVSSVNWLPIVLILIYIILYSVGLATVSYAILSELFPTNVKALASCCAMMYSGALNFGVTKLYQTVTDAFGAYVSFWGFCVLSAIDFVFMYYILPETKGLSLAQIQLNLNKKKTDIEITNDL